MFITSVQSDSDHTGFSLIETVVAIAILLIVVSGIMNLIYQGVTSSQLQQERITATYLAAEAIEFIRFDRDTYWLEGIGSNTFHDWLNDTDVSVCLSEYGCKVDSRPGDENISVCSGDCPVLNYNVDSKLYGYVSAPGLDWRDSRYRRTVEIEAVDHENDDVHDEAIITVTVSWERSGGETSSITMKESLTGWWR